MEMKKKILEKVEKDASFYEERFYGCSQSVLLALIDALNLPRDSAFKAATALAGGIGLLGYVCGAFTGGVMAISLKFGRDYEDFFAHDPESKRFKAYELTRKFHDRFVKEFGSCICKEIQKRKYGRWFNLADPKEFAEFEKIGGHGPKGCSEVVGKAARIAAEIILEAEQTQT